MDLSKVFKAYDVRAIYPDALNEEMGWRIGLGVGELLKSKHGKGRVVVTRDMRPAAPAMQEALTNGLRAADMDVVDLGMCDTSMQYFAIPHFDAVGGVQVTASHNPVEYIGYKISEKGAKPIGQETGLADIRKIAEDAPEELPRLTGKIEQRDVWDAYRDHIRSFLTPLRRPIKCFVDCSNGMATTLLPKVFEGIENLELVVINDRYTDTWAHEPNPLIKENVQPTIDGVKQHGCDLGACFDGDADRCMLVDDKGVICGCDHLTAWLAEHFMALARTDPAVHDPIPIVYDLRSSKVVAETIVGDGGKPVISMVGHVNVKAKLREHNAPFGGELSGHFYFKENAYADSGAITLLSALTVLAQQDGSLSDAVGPYRKYPQSGELNFENDDKQGTMDKLKEKYSPDASEILELDGVTIDCFDTKGWWANIRASNTEPLLRLNMEAKDRATLDQMLDEIKPTLGEVAEGH